MRAHLARHVSRQRRGSPALSTTRPQCLRSYPHPHPASPPPAFASVLPLASTPGHQFRRGLFEFLRLPKKEIKQPRLDPGFYKLLQLHDRIDMKVRTPPIEQTVEAFKQFFHHMQAQNHPVNSLQAGAGVAAMMYIIKQEKELETPLLDFEDMLITLKALVPPPAVEEEGGLAHRRGAIRVRDAILEKAREAEVEGAVDQEFLLSDEERREVLGLFLKCMAQYHGPAEAREAMVEYKKELEDAGIALAAEDAKLWPLVLRVQAAEGKEEELLELLEVARKDGMGFSPEAHNVMTTFYAQQNDKTNLEKWINTRIDNGERILPKALGEVMQFVLRNDEQAWGEEVLRKICDSDPSKAHWDMIFRWSVLLKGKSVEDVIEMINVMKGFGHEPDVDTVNTLIEAAMEKKDAYLAERFLSLLGSLDLEPSTRTFALQMNYRMDAGDLAGVQAPYDDFLEKCEQGLEPGTERDANLKVVNRYVRLLCEKQTPEHMHKAIRVVDDVEDRNLFIEPETVISVCMSLFALDRSFDVINVLSVYAGKYSMQERKAVANAFISYIRNKEHSTARVWDAYQLLRQFFTEMGKEDRTVIMKEFFDRRRSDMASHVFGHMRQLGDGVRPRAEEYIVMLEGLGRWPDEEALELVDNMLKLDPLVSFTTRLYNALMIAYGASESPERAEKYWQDIQNSMEGPSYRSLEVVFWTYGKNVIPRGYKRGIELWKKLQKMEIDVPEYVWRSYVGCLAAQARTQEVLDMLDEGWGGEEKLEDDTLAVVYNSFPQQDMKDIMETWAMMRIPEQWSQLLKGKRKQKQYIHWKTFTLDRVFNA